MPRIRTYFYNEHYFHEIDTKEKAYWLGYIFADGSVCVGRPWVLICVSKDEYFCSQIKVALDAGTTPIKRVTTGGYSKGKEKHYKVSFMSKILSTRLKELKGESSDLNLPDISEDFYPDFIRGFFDGDGSVYTYIKKSNGFKYNWLEVSIVCCPSMKNFISLTLTSAGINHRFKKSRTDYMTYLVVSNTQDTKKFYDYIYSEAVTYLPRKKAVFDEYLKATKKTKRVY
jgi:hypothetical protein